VRRLICLVCVAVVALAAPRAAIHPNILLVTLDTTRADRMGFLGSTRGLTPELDALARGAFVFTRAYSQAPITTASHATILTGTYPPFHRVGDFGAPLPTDVPYLPDVLRRAGYRTAAFVGSLVLDPRAGTAPGFDRGFDLYDAGFHLRRPGENRYQSIERRGDEVVRRAAAWIASAGADRPWFAWVHLFDAHDPYDPPADLKQRFRSAPYDGEIASVDRLAAGIVRTAGADAIVAIAADHGESLGDHGENTHGVFLYDATLHVPLLLRIPGRTPARVESRVRLADLAPTLLEAAGMPAPPEMQGESMLRLLPGAADASRSNDPVDRPVYSETDYPRRAFGWSALASWRADQFLFVRAPTLELYDVRVDPGATRNLAASRSRVTEGLDAELERFIRRSAGHAAAEPGAKVDPALAERLASLGYVGGSGGAPVSTGVDAKDRIRVANDLQAAITAVEDARWAAAISLLEHVVAAEPSIPIAQLNLGVSYARTGQIGKAIASLEKATSLDPGSIIGHYELGLALYDAGDLRRAADRFGIVAARMPQWADARYSLASVYARINRVDDAVSELIAALAIERRHFRANLLLGRIETLRGRAAEALPYLRVAVEAQPSNAEAHSFLADAYEKLGDGRAAAAERDRAKALAEKKP
jgi:choline-sulfatase